MTGGLVGRWEIDLVLTITNTGENDVIGVFPLPPSVSPPGRAWPMTIPRVYSSTYIWASGEMGKLEGTVGLPVPDSISFDWTYSATGSVNLTFTGDVCALTVQGPARIPTYTIATASMLLQDTGDVGIYVLNRNLMRGRTERVTASFNLREGGPTSLKVYNSIGQRIKTLFNEVAVARQDYDFAWDGTNDQGERVASGVYYLRLEGTAFVKTKKVALIK